MYTYFWLCLTHKKEELQRHGYSKGHTRNDAEYCIIKYCKHFYCDLVATDPNFVYRLDQPKNIIFLLDDLCSWGLNFTFEEYNKIRPKAWSIIWEKMNGIYEYRRYGYQLLLGYWMRLSNLDCLGILDKRNVDNIILKYYGIIHFNERTLNITVRRYLGVWSPARRLAMINYFRLHPTRPVN